MRQLALGLLLFAAAAASAEDGDVLHVKGINEDRGGSMYMQNGYRFIKEAGFVWGRFDRTWQQTGDRFVSDGAPELPAQSIEEVRRLAGLAGDDRAAMLQQLGVTPERVEALRSGLENLLHAGCPRPLTPESAGQEVAALFKLPRQWGHKVVWREGMLGQSLRLELSLSGRQPLTLVSSGFHLGYGVVPWIVTSGAGPPEINLAPELNRVLASLLNLPGFSPRDLEVTEWETALLLDSVDWKKVLLQCIDRLPGADQALQRVTWHHEPSYLRKFHMRRQSRFFIEPPQNWLPLEVKPKSGLIDGFPTAIRLIRGLPQGSWSELLRPLDDLEGKASRHPWIGQWKAANPLRRVIIPGSPLVYPRFDEEQKYDELLLTDGSRWSTRVQFSASGEECFVLGPLRKRPRSTGHWLDTLTLSERGRARIEGDQPVIVTP